MIKCALDSYNLPKEKINESLQTLKKLVHEDELLRSKRIVFELIEKWISYTSINYRDPAVDILYRKLQRDLSDEELDKFVNLFNQSLPPFSDSEKLNNSEHSSDIVMRSVNELNRLGICFFENYISHKVVSQIKSILATTDISDNNGCKVSSPLMDMNCSSRLFYNLCQISNTLEPYLHSPQILDIARKYLGNIDVIRGKPSAWLNTNHHTHTYDNGFDARRSRAQEFHLDADNPRFVKFFIYLTDVSAKSGPHQIVTHNQKRIPDSIREFEQKSSLHRSAIPENLLLPFKESGEIRSVIGRRGSAFLVDTLRPHRGLEPQVGYSRLILMCNFTITNLGNP